MISARPMIPEVAVLIATCEAATISPAAALLRYTAY